MAASKSINRTRLMQLAAANPSASRTRLLQIMADSTSVDRTELLRTIAGNTDPSPPRTQLLQEIADSTSVNRTYLWRLIAGGGLLSLTNAQKLALSSSTPPGTVVKVTNAFILHESNYGDVFYYTNGTAPSGGTAPAIEKYSPVGRPDLDNITWRWNNSNDASAGGAWGDAGGNYAGDDGDVTHFWDTPVGTIDHTYTFTHPAVQTLAYGDPSHEEFWTTDGLLHIVYERNENGLIYRDENGAPAEEL